MADKSESERRKKHKKKHKKPAKTSAEEQESAVVESADTNASQNGKTASPEQRPVTQKESKISPEKMAPKAELSSNRQWSDEQEKLLLQNLKKYTSRLSGEKQYSQRVNWSLVEQVDDFTQFEMQKKYKMLIKKVRKTRSVLEIVDDAISLHNEKKIQQIGNTKKAKQPPSAFSIFCKAKRASLKEKHPELTFGEIHKKLCERWRELPEDKREKYVSKAEKAKSEHYEELRKMLDEQLSMIKKPMSAYDLWKSERLQDEDLEGDENEDDFLAEWDNLPKSTKKGWIQAATGEKERYNIEVKSIKKGLNDSAARKPETKPKHQKQAAKTNVKEESSSDEQQQSTSSLDNPALKRKMGNSEQAAKSPAKKAVKKESSSSDSEDSSDED